MDLGIFTHSSVVHSTLAEYVRLRHCAGCWGSEEAAVSALPGLELTYPDPAWSSVCAAGCGYPPPSAFAQLLHRSELRSSFPAPPPFPTGLSNPDLIGALPHLNPFELFTSKVFGLALKAFTSWPQPRQALPQTQYARYSLLPPCCNLIECPFPSPQTGEPRLSKHRCEPHLQYGASLLRNPPPLVQSSQVVFCTQYNK